MKKDSINDYEPSSPIQDSASRLSASPMPSIHENENEIDDQLFRLKKVAKIRSNFVGSSMNSNNYNST